MKIVIRNRSSSNVILDFSGFDVVPTIPTILPGVSVIVETSLSVLAFRKVPSVVTELGAGNISFSAQGGVGSLN